jgi:hypothetical protein
MTNGYRIVVQTDRETADSQLFAAEYGFAVEHRQSSPNKAADGLATAHVLEPMSLTILVTTLSVLAYRIVEHLLRRDEYGVQIDARTTPATISTVAGIPNGFVVVIEANGATKTHSATAMGANSLTELLAGILKTTGTNS